MGGVGGCGTGGTDGGGVVGGTTGFEFAGGGVMLGVWFGWFVGGV